MIDLKQYRKATSYTRSAQLLGYTVGAALGQLLVSFNLMSYNNIIVFTLVLIAIALLTSFFLPMPQHSMFFHRRQALVGKTETEETEADVEGSEDTAEQAGGSMVSLEKEDGGLGKEAGKPVDEKEPVSEVLEESASVETCGRLLLQLWRDFLQCYSSRQLLYWSVWWALATCGFNQTINYVQVSGKGQIPFFEIKIKQFLSSLHCKAFLELNSKTITNY